MAGKGIKIFNPYHKLSEDNRRLCELAQDYENIVDQPLSM